MQQIGVENDAFKKKTPRMIHITLAHNSCEAVFYTMTRFLLTLWFIHVFHKIKVPCKLKLFFWRPVNFVGLQ